MTFEDGELVKAGHWAFQNIWQEPVAESLKNTLKT